MVELWKVFEKSRATQSIRHAKWTYGHNILPARSGGDGAGLEKGTEGREKKPAYYQNRILKTARHVPRMASLYREPPDVVNHKTATAVGGTSLRKEGSSGGTRRSSFRKGGAGEVTLGAAERYRETGFAG